MGARRLTIRVLRERPGFVEGEIGGSGELIRWGATFTREVAWEVKP